MHGPIGLFDSGVGGVTIWKEVRKLLPHESTVYLADGANAPYGEKNKKEILERSKRCVELLLNKDCKLIVVACNTATTNAIDYLRTHYKVPLIGIEPAIKPAALRTKTKKVGVLATKGTLSSHLFHNTSKLHASGIEVLVQQGTGLVRLIEAKRENSPEIRRLLKGYIRPMLENQIDCLVLGCTHYPILIPLLRELLPAHVHIIDSGAAVAKRTKAILDHHGILSPSGQILKHEFFTNANELLLATFVDDQNAKVSYLDF